MQNKEHLPVLGVGPIYVTIILVMTITGIILDFFGFLDSGKFYLFKIPFTIIGFIFIIEGIIIWSMATFNSKLVNNVKNNNLITTGIYAYVRNPIYSAFLFLFSGLLMFTCNLWLFILPFIYWGLLTVLMKRTEEKWLKERYGKEYTDYSNKVNRAIPWFKK